MKNTIRKTGQRFPFMSRFLTGIIVALALTLTAFEWTTVTTETRELEYDFLYDDNTEEILPPIRYQTEKLEQPKPKAKDLSGPIEVKKDIPETVVKVITETPIENPIIDEPIVIEIDKKDYGMIDEDLIDDNIPYTKVQVFAHYNDCSGLINEELMECSKLDIQNRVKMNFRVTPQLRSIGGRQGALMTIVINKEGEITSIEVEQTTSKAMARAATKAVEKLPKMNPAQQQGRKVALSMKIPIVLTIQ